ncbi:ATP-binding protein [Kitasatospora viridis]|uniref:Tetratricopeptide repeat protein n=1 Tax=Kitasatospora viridis TaxID=281105 RepID=A0A561SEB1_9ACTN|nr:tetratricopeptide repeat protein [Kitasatospora viridis]TWF73191.1 tetratricopeptide repeat protein [Kitasatospora viridis]
MSYWAVLPDGVAPAYRQLLEELRALKDERRLTLRQLERLTHYSASSWQRWLNGLRPLTPEAVQAFSGALGVDGARLLALLGDDAGPADLRGAGPTAAPATIPVRTGRAAGGSAGNGIVPRQLPIDTRVFTGRSEEFAELLALAESAATGSDNGMVVISAIDGMAGIGKSALAVRVAHRVSESFPDGQLFVDLRGNTAGADPVGAHAALAFLLRSLGVPPESIPEEVGERAALYRSRLAGTRTLIVLDNAAGTAQVRPLLPGAPGCLVLITCRTVLAGLDDAHLVSLDVLSEDEALALLHKVAGPGRIPAGHPAAAQLLALCGGLPLAVRIVGARLRLHRALRIEEFLARIRDDADRLSQLKDEDRNLRSLFDASYTALYEAEQRMFRLVGLIPGPDLDAHAAASMFGTDLRHAQRLLESLLDRSLLVQPVPGRYRMHDLLRAYARTLTDSAPTAALAIEAGDAVERLFRYYLHAAHRADRRLDRFGRPGPRLLGAPTGSAEPDAPELPDRAAAMAWLRVEHENLLALVRHARTHDRHEWANALTAELSAYLHFEGRYQESISLQHAVISSTQVPGGQFSVANALMAIGRNRHMSDVTDAADTYRRALVIYRRLGDRLGEANALHELGRLLYLQGDLDGVAELNQQALTIYRELGDLRGQAGALRELGNRAVLIGDYAAATALLHQAMAIQQDLDDPVGQAHLLIQLGRTSHSTGDSGTATSLLERALALYQELGLRRDEANVLKDLGTVARESGNLWAAMDLQERALVIYRDLGSHLAVAGAMHELGEIRLASGDHAGAVELLEQAIATYHEIGDTFAETEAVHALAGARHGLGQDIEAAALLDRYLIACRTQDNRAGQAKALNSIGDLELDTAGPRAALPRYQDALALARRFDHPREEARALNGTARCHERLGGTTAAIVALRQALAIHRRMDSPDAMSVAARLAELESASGTALLEPSPSRAR